MPRFLYQIEFKFTQRCHRCLYYAIYYGLRSETCFPTEFLPLFSRVFQGSAERLEGFSDSTSNSFLSLPMAEIIVSFLLKWVSLFADRHVDVCRHFKRIWSQRMWKLVMQRSPSRL